jgi:hypothetical protein
MNDKPKNPPAFPLSDEAHITNEGMTLRDYFAGQLVAGISCSDTLQTPEIEAEWAYKMADAMLAEREKGQ